MSENITPKTWFKFYAQDFLSDMKMLELSVPQRMMWVTILCLASSEGKGGFIGYCTEEGVKRQMGISENENPWAELNSAFLLFENLGMIEIVGNGILVKNFAKRQNSHFTPAEKQARYRSRQTEKVTDVTPRKVTKVTLDKRRVEKNREDNKKELEEKTPKEITKTFFETSEQQLELLAHLVDSMSIDPNLAEQELKAFVSYWTERTPSGKQQLWETKKTFEVGRRLAYWFRHIPKFAGRTSLSAKKGIVL